MTSLGFHPKPSKTVAPSTLVECLGLELDGTSLSFGLSASKLQRLVTMTRNILNADKVSGDELRVLLGKWSWACLCCRPSFAVFNSVYRFMEVAGSREFSLWPSVRNELSCISDIAPLLFASLARPWSEVVVATDASSTGMGVVATQSEKFGLYDQVEDAVESRWSTIVSTRWKFEEHINVLELRAIDTAMRWLVSRPQCRNSRVLLFSDSSVAVDAVSKGRSSSFHILTRLRSLSATMVAGGITLYVSWIPSWLNPADAASRL